MKISGDATINEIARRIERIERHLGIYENDDRDISNPNHHGAAHGTWYGMPRSAYHIHGVRVTLVEWEAYKDKQKLCDKPECHCHKQLGKQP